MNIGGVNLPTEVFNLILIRVIFAEGSPALRLRLVSQAWKALMDNESTWNSACKAAFTWIQQLPANNKRFQLLKRLDQTIPILKPISTAKDRMIASIDQGFKWGVNEFSGSIPLDQALDDEENTGLHIALLKSDPDMADIFIDHVSVNRQNLYGSTPLHLAVKAKLEGIVKRLLAKGADKSLSENRPANSPPRLAADYAEAGTPIAKLLQ